MLGGRPRSIKCGDTSLLLCGSSCLLGSAALLLALLWLSLGLQAGQALCLGSRGLGLLLIACSRLGSRSRRLGVWSQVQLLPARVVLQGRADVCLRGTAGLELLSGLVKHRPPGLGLGLCEDLAPVIEDVAMHDQHVGWGCGEEGHGGLLRSLGGVLARLAGGVLLLGCLGGLSCLMLLLGQHKRLLKLGVARLDVWVHLRHVLLVDLGQDLHELLQHSLLGVCGCLLRGLAGVVGSGGGCLLHRRHRHDVAQLRLCTLPFQLRQGAHSLP
mmetsp:Transcript_18634/g.52386  ORF Transcript_18634/g.52386 Transcript_18634/m.52386 type:complete len:271 (-) Transcript_18634:1270-2082(-)